MTSGVAGRRWRSLLECTPRSSRSLVRQPVLADRAAVRGLRRGPVGAGAGRASSTPRNPSHKMLMSVLGGMSESERQHVQARVRAAMDAQVVNEGRHQGGRAPYGYVVVDGGPHPNPRKAAEGYRLRVLAIDEASAEVVRRIFAEYLDGKGDRAIANGLNRDGDPVSVGAAAGPEPAPAGRRLAGQHGAGDLGEPALHRLRVLRAVDQARDAARPGRRGGRARDPVPPGQPGPDRAFPRSPRTRRSCRCEDFTQAQLLRRSQARPAGCAAQRKAGTQRPNASARGRTCCAAWSAAACAAAGCRAR